jgi:arylsulfatase A-like enzyme
MALYGGEIAAVDNALGLLDLALAEGRGHRPAVTLFTADHGECFDHGVYFEHAYCLYDGAVRVPLVVRSPGRIAAGRREAAPVELRDLGRTLLVLAGLEVPGSFGGRALFDRRGEAAPLSADHYALIQYPLSDLGHIRLREKIQAGIDRVMGQPVRTQPPDASRVVALRSGRWKYLSGREPELYDLQSDPDETRNLAAAQPKVARELAAVARRLLAEHPLTVLDAGELAPELREQLRALGYL